MNVYRLFCKFILCLLISKNILTDYSQNKDSFCQPDYLTTVNFTTKERENMRSTYSLSFQFAQDSFINNLNTLSIPSFISGSGYFLIIFILISVIAFASAIVFISSLKCCINQKSTDYKKTKNLWTSALIIWILIWAGVIAMIIFLFNIKNSFPLMICGVSSVAEDLISGVGTTGSQFLGFNNYINVMKNFALEANLFLNVVNNFANIATVQLPVTASLALNGLSNFYNTYNTSTTSNSTGNQSIPYLIGNFTNGTVSQLIANEFFNYWTVSSRLDTAASIGLNLNGDALVALQSAINASTPFYANVSANFATMFNTFSNNFTTIQNNFSIIYSVILIGEIVTCFLIGIVLIFLMCMAYQKKHENKLPMVKILLFFIALLVFAMGLIGSLFMFVSLFLNTTCGIVQHLLLSPSTLNSTFGLSTAPLPMKIAAQCVLNQNNGSLSYLNSTFGPQLFKMDQAIDGISVYNSFVPTINQNLQIFSSISATMNTWSPIFIGVVFDQPGIGALYNQFVLQNNVTTPQYVFNLINCTVATNCFLISNVTNFSASENANNRTLVSDLFRVLYLYITSEMTLINSMIKDLSGPSSNTPNSLLINSRTKLLSNLRDVNSIVAIMPNTLRGISSFQGGFLNYTNCTILKNEFQNLEASMCFSMRFNLLILSLVILTVIFVQICVLWLLWFGFYQIKDKSHLEYDTTDGQASNDPSEKQPFKHGSKN